MAVPKFIFTQYSKSFKVFIQNLEQLSVSQIQEIESFVLKRKGIFDFNNYTFVIQKKLEFSEFLKLIKLSELSAICFDKPIVKAPKERIGFGQYKGMTYDELPDAYILWLKSNYHGTDRDIISKEVKKRKI